MVWSIAWRNIWRNRVRSWVVIASLTVGMFAGVFSSTFMQGMIEQRLRAGIEIEVSHIQVHHQKFREANDFQYQITNQREICNTIKEIPEVDGVSPRLAIQGMAASAETGTGVTVKGIEPWEEVKVTNLYTRLHEGKWFEGVRRNPVVIGQKLADKLKIRLRSKLVVTFQDAEGNITGAAFKVCGIYKTSNSVFDETNVFVRNKDLIRVSGMPGDAVHEIVVHTGDQEKVAEITRVLTEKLPEYEVMSWDKIQPELGMLIGMGNKFMMIFVMIILLALGFGVVNTMLMAVLERVKEIGMLMAIGMQRKRVFFMIMLETILLCVVGGVIGIMLALGATKMLARSGIDLSMWAKGFEQMGYDSIVYPVIDVSQVTWIIILVVITGIVAAIYPARKALKYNPADAIRTE